MGCFKVPQNVAKKTDGTFNTLTSYVRKKNSRAMPCALSRGSEYDYKQLQHDYNISTGPMHQDRPLVGADRIFATGFSGMDCMGYILGKLRRDAAPRHLWTCDVLKCSRDFTVNNYAALNTYTNVENRPLPPPGCCIRTLPVRLVNVCQLPAAGRDGTTHVPDHAIQFCYWASTTQSLSA